MVGVSRLIFVAVSSFSVLWSISGCCSMYWFMVGFIWFGCSRVG